MKQNRRQAVANARRAASQRVNRRGAGMPRAAAQQRAGMRSATGQETSFQPPAGEFISARPLSKKQQAAIATASLMPFL
jgi:hypothetical protein